jgi:hypothetical protein
MRLSELNPQFMRRETREETWTRRNEDGTTEEVTGPREYYPHVETAGEAQGISFLCPTCFKANNGPVGTHSIMCWSRSRGIPEDVTPGPGRWDLQGTSYEDLTLGADPPNTLRSVKLDAGCHAHFLVTNGEVQDA